MPTLRSLILCLLAFLPSFSLCSAQVGPPISPELRKSILAMKKDAPRLQRWATSVDINQLQASDTLRKQVQDSKELIKQGLMSVNENGDKALRGGELSNEIQLMVTAKALVDSVELLSSCLRDVGHQPSRSAEAIVLRWELTADSQVAQQLNFDSYSFVMERAKHIDQVNRDGAHKNDVRY